MDKKITYSLIICFFISAFFVLMYSFGYRIEITKKPEVIPTGGVFVKQKPAPAFVILNGESKGKTSQFTGELFMQGLREGAYSLEVFKEGYQLWKKHIKVRPYEVTEFKFITLFKENYTKEPYLNYTDSSKTDSNKIQSPEKETNAEQKTSQKTKQNNQNNQNNHKTKNSQNNQNTTENSQPSSQTTSFNIIEFAKGVYGIQKEKDFFVFFNDNLFKTTLTKQQTQHINKNNFFIKDDILAFLLPSEKSEKPSEKPSEKSNSSAFFYDLIFIDGERNIEDKITFPFPFKEKIKKISLFKDSILFMTGNDIYISQLQNFPTPRSSFTPPTLLVTNIHDFYVDSGKLFFVEDALFQNNLKTLVVATIKNNRIEVLKKIPLDWYKGDIKVREFEGLTFIKTGDSLLLLDGLKLSFLQGEVSNFLLSPDNQKVAISSSKKVILFYVKDRQAQPEKKKFDKVYLANFQDNIESLQWLDGAHLILKAGDKILAIETDDRDRVNNSLITQLEDGTFYYNNDDNILFFIERDGIYRISNFIENNLIF